MSQNGMAISATNYVDNTLLALHKFQAKKQIYIYIYLFIYFVKGLLRHDGLVVFCVQGFNSQLITSVIILGSSV